MTNLTPTPESLRAEATRIEQASAQSNRGKVFVLYTGVAIHNGETYNQFLVDNREATEAEVIALCVIPEFKAYLDKVRGEV